MNASKPMVIVALVLGWVGSSSLATAAPSARIPSLKPASKPAPGATKKNVQTSSVRLRLQKVVGSLDKKVVERVVRRQRGNFIECFEDAGAPANVSVRALLVVGAQGRVRWAKAITANAKLSSCLTTRLRAMRFPKPSAGKVRLYYNLQFGPGNNSGAPPRTTSPVPAQAPFVLVPGKIKGTLDKRVIRLHLLRGFRRYGTCASPSQSGTVKLRFVIGPAGRVDYAWAKGIDDTVASCLQRTLRRIRFPKTDGRVRVFYALRFGNTSTGHVTPGTAVTKGSLKSAVIRRYIRRSIHKVKSCYQRALSNQPGLAGTVNVSFRITSTGAVVAARGRGVSRRVSRCIAGVVSKIVFPKPKGGGVVRVTYPFVFRANK